MSKAPWLKDYELNPFKNKLVIGLLVPQHTNLENHKLHEFVLHTHYKFGLSFYASTLKSLHNFFFPFLHAFVQEFI